jgi:hypothetical protein
MVKELSLRHIFMEEYEEQEQTNNYSNTPKFKKKKSLKKNKSCRIIYMYID